MRESESRQIESDSIQDFARIMGQQSVVQTQVPQPAPPAHARLNLDPDQLKNGLGQLVLAVVKLLHELMERQALRRIDAGSLSEDQIERLGVTLMRQSEELERLRREFGLDEEDLNLDLGPLGRLF